MRFRLSYKIFATLILASLLVVGLMVGLIRFYVARNFADYVNKSLLERYNQVTEALAAEYQIHKSWQGLKDNPERWLEILRSSLAQKVFEPGGRSLQHPDSESRRFSDSDQEVPSPVPHRRSQRLARKLALFDADKRHIAGGRAGVAYDGYTLKAIVVDGQIVGELGFHKKAHLTNPLAVGFLTQQSQILYIIGCGILVLAAVVTFLLSRHLLAPVEKLTTGTQALMSRRFDTRIEVKSQDELGQLAADFNAMAQTLENYKQMRQQWISDIAHELRTPLSILRGEIEALKDGIREVNHDTLDSLYAEVRHLTKIVNDLHELSLADTGALSIKNVPVNPATVLKETLGNFKQRLAENQIAIECDLENQAPITIIADADRLRQLFSNLVENVLRYVDAPGVLKIGQVRTKNSLILSFEDSGPGVPETALAHLFDRLYRVD